MTKTRTEQASELSLKIKVEGHAPIMFDAVRGGGGPRPPASKPGELPGVTSFENVENLFYYPPGGGKHIVFPSTNIEAFFTNQDAGAIPLIVGRGGKVLAKRAMAKIFASPEYTPITRKGKKIIPNGFDKNGNDAKAGLMAIEEKAMNPNQKFLIVTRPFVPLPWEIEFNILLYQDRDITKDSFERWLRIGGQEIGFGNHRPRYGRFRVTRFEVV